MADVQAVTPGGDKGDKPLVAVLVDDDDFEIAPAEGGERGEEQFEFAGTAERRDNHRYEENRIVREHEQALQTIGGGGDGPVPARLTQFVYKTLMQDE